ncbi:MAG: hypothetical protein ACI9TH_000758 [Kiritimatiellia bacterium]|jgi:hypothetical protein
MNYYDIIAAVPALAFGMPPPMTLEAFIQTCEGRMPSGDEAELAHFVAGDFHACRSDFSRNWASVEQSLRNEVAGLRAARWKVDPAPYAQYGQGYDSFIDRTVVDAYTKSNPREREQVLDQARWHVLEDLVVPTPFGLAAILATGEKLRIMNRWSRLREDKGWERLDEAINTLLTSAGVPSP